MQVPNPHQSLYRGSSVNIQALLTVLGIGMIAISIYLTQHYFEVKYPTGLGGGSLCNINSFFNCDATTLSPASNIAGIPISIFGILMGVFLFIGFLFYSEEYERSLHLLLGINFVGCIALFLYSLIGLNHLCPFCTLYYVFSGVVLFLFFKFSPKPQFYLKPFVIFGVLAVIVSGISFSVSQERESEKSQIAKSLIKQFNELANLGMPDPQIGHYINYAGDDAPLKVAFFSDFQCPACKALSDMTHKIIERYKDKINLQYLFYPLDPNCNSQMKNSLHPLACKASYLATCVSTEKFVPVHDAIFTNQEGLTQKWIDDYAKRENVTACLNSPDTKAKVENIIAAANPFNIRSTPTMLVNGVKIEGVLPPNQLFIIFDEVLRKAGHGQ